MKLTDRTILITGGTSGIGYELVRQLAPNSRRIIVIGRNRKHLDALKTSFNGVVTYACSLSDRPGFDRTFDEIKDRHPDISVVFNNAAIQETPTFLESDFCYDSIEREIAVNLTAPAKICALMLKPMLNLEQPCAFVNLSSGLALFPKKSSAVYCATKAGIHSLSRSLRYQLEETQVRVFEAILPLVDTPMTAGRGHGKLAAAQAAQGIIKGIEADTYEIYLGKARFIPALSRVMPAVLANIMKSA